jgi:hypothetical protein
MVEARASTSSHPLLRRYLGRHLCRVCLFRRLKGLPDVRRRTEIEQWYRQWSEGTEVMAVEFREYAREGIPLRPAISEEMAADSVNGPDLVDMILRRIVSIAYSPLRPQPRAPSGHCSPLSLPRLL